MYRYTVNIDYSTCSSSLVDVRAKNSSSVKESYSAEAPPKSPKSNAVGFSSMSKGNPRNARLASDFSKLDLPASLPQKDGKVDMSQYAKYKTGGLRQKIHEAIRGKKCIRCWSAEHLRSSCPEPPKSWVREFDVATVDTL